ncbi:HEPN domain-containing protein [Salinisphaera sp. T31B1]|uniref:ApeA N-terminal domain 1-containing protein n=1 Tax=Salinisphaera sp. T31B1 TaxID=727963 RepID=UPI003340E7BD
MRAGYFWLPDEPDKKIPGTLTISDGGEIELEVVGLFDESIDALNGKDDLSRIVGHVEKDGQVTLENCFYKKKNIAFGNIARSLVHVNKAFCAVAYDKDEDVTFNTMSFSIEGLDEWIGISGITVSYGSDYRTAAIAYVPQDEMVFSLTNGFSLHICFGYTLPGFPTTTEAKITQRAYFKLSSEEPREFEEFVSVIHQITYFICFAVDATVTIRDVSATSNEIMREVSEDKKIPVSIKVYYPSLPFSESTPKIDPHRMLFRFDNIQKDAESIFNSWLTAYLIIRPALGLYFSAASGAHKYLDGKFLALAQALETYHRRTSSETLMAPDEFRSLVARSLWSCPKEHRKWLRNRIYYGNEISLGQRIKRIIDPYKSHIGNSRQRSKLIRAVVNTRNYLTHYTEALESETVGGKNLWLTCQKMEAIFQLHLLEQLGFSEEAIQGVLANNYKLKQKLDEI